MLLHRFLPLLPGEPDRLEIHVRRWFLDLLKHSPLQTGSEEHVQVVVPELEIHVLLRILHQVLVGRSVVERVWVGVVQLLQFLKDIAGRVLQQVRIVGQVVQKTLLDWR